MAEAEPISPRIVPALRDFPPDVWEERLGELLDRLAKERPAARETLAAMRDNGVFRSLLRVNARFHRDGGEPAESAVGGAPPDYERTFRSILDLARQTPMSDADVLDAWAMFGLLGEAEFESMAPPAPESEAGCGARLAGLAILAVALGVVVWAIWRLVARVGVVAALSATGRFLALFIPAAAALVWVVDRSNRAFFPKDVYAAALARLAELGCRVPSQVTLTTVYGGLAGFAIAVLAAVAAWALIAPAWLAIPCFLGAWAVSRHLFYPRPRQFRDWALRQIAARGGLFPKE